MQEDGQVDKSENFPVDTTRINSRGNSILEYVQPKIHQDIRLRDWSLILVKGHYVRSGSAVTADTEKSNKPFNRHRPTATILDSDTISLNCFPGKDYVRHYAEVVAAYLISIGKDPSVVRYVVPTKEECIQPLLQSNLKDMGPVDIVIIGYVHRLSGLIGPTWQGMDAENIFAWQKFPSPQGRTIAFLGCMPSFWGDISGHLVRALKRLNNVKCVLYVGKAGSLDPNDCPNTLIATGSRSYLGDRIVTWKNVLAQELLKSSEIRDGDHVNVHSPLVETADWLEDWRQRCRWVDCEIGYMADASVDVEIAFGYLHIISDNVTNVSLHDLSIEELDEVQSLRALLFNEIESVLKSFLDRWNGKMS